MALVWAVDVTTAVVVFAAIDELDAADVVELALLVVNETVVALNRVDTVAFLTVEVVTDVGFVVSTVVFAVGSVVFVDWVAGAVVSITLVAVGDDLAVTVEGA